MKSEPEFATEADLCARFMKWARKEGWTPYPETEGWDILLVGADGTQIGVQAKLRLNIKVLAQAVPDQWSEQWHNDGPDFRAILVPAGEGCESLCGALGITTFRPRYRGAEDFLPALKNARPGWGECWHWWAPKKRHELPAYVPDVTAGASGPVQLTVWKVAALKVCALLELRGHVTRDDFKRLKIDHRRWSPSNWLVVEDGVYKRGPALDFDRQHPDVYAQVLADVRADTALLGLPLLPGGTV